MTQLTTYEFPSPPAGWTGETFGPAGRRYERILTRESVILTIAERLDGREWLHFSIAHPSRVPHWDELRQAKDHFIGDRKAIMVFPRKSEYVNIHPYCLHLFAVISGDDPLIDFTEGTGSL